MLKIFRFVYPLTLLCIVTSSSNETESSTVAEISTLETTKSNIEAMQPPTFKEASVEASHRILKLKIGGKLHFRCGVRGKPKPVVRFYKDNQLLNNSRKIEVSGMLLRVSDVQLDDGGDYKCEASNNVGNATLPFHVIVKDGSQEAKDETPSDPRVPHWTNVKKMKKQLHAEPAGNTVQFRCQAAGASPLKTEWFKNGKEIEKGHRIGEYKFRHKYQMIVLESVVLSDKGVYKCVVSNRFGSINHTYELDVAERSAHRPILQFGLPANKTVYVGDDVEFNCKVYSDPHPHMQWIKKIEINGSKIDPVTKSPYVKILKKAGVNTTNADMQTLTLKNVSFEDAGEYTCLAGNAIGISHMSAWLTVLPVPDATTTMRTTEVDKETHYLIYIFGCICLVIVAAFIFYLCRNRYYSKEIPRLVPIEDPDNIPPMTKMEEPLMLIGNEQAWRRMYPHDQIEINIQPDLQWELKREDILLHDRIDEGFFGQVFMADLIKCSNGSKKKMTAAVKMLKSTRTEKDMLDLLTEMDQMKRVGKHKNIVNLLGVCTQNGMLWLVTEYAQQGNLRDYLRRNRPANMLYPLCDPSSPNVPAPRSEPLSQKDLMSAAYQVVRGMEYLAQKKCVHRDLAARNVLVTDDYVMKIADFGLARDIRSNDYYRKHTRGHLPYKWMALEAMMDNVFTHATDVWSFGVLLWEIFSLGGSPYPGVKTHELVRFLRQGQRLDHPQFASMELYRLMRDCWEEKPQRRPKFRQLVEDLDRMLAESSSVDYIDLSAPFAADCSESDSDESGIDAEVASSRDSANATGEDSDSVFEHASAATERLLRHHVDREDHQVDDEARSLLDQRPEDNVVCNGHARLQSDV